MGGGFIITVKKRLTNFHLRNGSVSPKCHLRCVICWVRRGCTEGLLVVVGGLACCGGCRVGDVICALLIAWWHIFSC